MGFDRKIDYSMEYAQMQVSESILKLVSDTIKVLSIDMVERAKSGHPGAPMGLSDIASVLWCKFIKVNPENPNWHNRDRFILSAGHASALLYSVLHLAGFNITKQDLMNFRQWGSKTPGHPEYEPEIGIETTTGPLGQGFAVGVGMAIAKRILAEIFNRNGFELINHYIYGIVSDGDLMEGISYESSSIAGHLGLSEIIYIYDSNRVTIDGSTDLTFSEDVRKRFESLGWHVLEIDGHDFKQIEQAIDEARNQKEKPSLIIAHTKIGKDSPAKEGTSKCHGAPLGEEEVRAVKQKLGWTLGEFEVPQPVKDFFASRREYWKNEYQKWEIEFGRFCEKYPAMAEKWSSFFSKSIPSDIENYFPKYEAGKKVATRNASEDVLQVLADKVQNLVGGSADLAESVKTIMKKYGFVSKNNFAARNIHFGVREHAMGGILNGIALYGGLIPYGGTFLVFSDYMRPAIRIACLTKAKVIYLFSHDSVFLGEDGPTHQPIEHLASLRAIPNLVVIRPADANEVPYAWKIALEQKRPVAIILTRQEVEVIDRKKYADVYLVKNGGYVIAKNSQKPDVIILSSGSEVSVSIKVHEELLKNGVSSWVVNLASWEIFDEQDEKYKESVIPPDVKNRVVIEAGSSFGWAKYAGQGALCITIEEFGHSAPYKVIQEKIGFTVEKITQRVLSYISSRKQAP